MIITQPELLPGAFAYEGDKNTIPANNDGLSGLASIAKGFPPITQQPLASGGIPPQRADFNGIFNIITAFLVYLQNGGIFGYVNTLDYDINALVRGENGIYLCIKQNGPNTSNGVQDLENSEYWLQILTANNLAIMTGSTESKGGTAGLVPAPSAGADNRYLSAKGTFDLIAAMTGASASENGVAGLVPAPTNGQQGYALNGGGQWADIGTFITDITEKILAPTSNNASLQTLLGGLAYMLQLVTGKTNWTDAPDINLGTLFSLVGNLSSGSDVTWDGQKFTNAKLGVSGLMAQNGYIQFGPNFGGLIVQWGRSSSKSVTFSITFLEVLTLQQWQYDTSTMRDSGTINNIKYDNQGFNWAGGYGLTYLAIGR